MSLAKGPSEKMENDTSLAHMRPAGLYRVGEERQHRVTRRGRPRTSYVEEKVMEFLEAIAEGVGKPRESPLDDPALSQKAKAMPEPWNDR